MNDDEENKTWIVLEGVFLFKIQILCKVFKIIFQKLKKKDLKYSIEIILLENLIDLVLTRIIHEHIIVINTPLSFKERCITLYENKI